MKESDFLPDVKSGKRLTIVRPLRKIFCGAVFLLLDAERTGGGKNVSRRFPAAAFLRRPFDEESRRVGGVRRFGAPVRGCFRAFQPRAGDNGPVRGVVFELFNRGREITGRFGSYFQNLALTVRVQIARRRLASYFRRLKKFYFQENAAADFSKTRIEASAKLGNGVLVLAFDVLEPPL